MHKVIITFFIGQIFLFFGALFAEIAESLCNYSEIRTFAPNGYSYERY
jgi:hypothetical protein